MDFKIKIDLFSQSIINETPVKTKKRRRHTNGGKSGKSNKNTSEFKEPLEKEKGQEIGKNPNEKRRMKKRSGRGKPREVEGEKPKLNSNSIISLTLPNNENFKGDQSQKLNMIMNKKPRHWEKRWVLVPNVFEFTKEIWLKKWVLVDGEDDISDNNVN